MHNSNNACLKFIIRSEIDATLFQNMVSYLKQHSSGGEHTFIHVDANAAERSITLFIEPHKNITPEFCKSIMQQTMDSGEATSVSKKRTFYYKVGGITCGACTASIGQTLNTQYGDLIKFNTNWKNQTINVTVPNTINSDDITKTIYEAGFDPELVNELSERALKIEYIAPENEVKFEFAVAGLSSKDDCINISTIISQKIPHVNRFDISLSRQVLTVYASLPNTKQTLDVSPTTSLQNTLLRSFQQELGTVYQLEPLKDKKTENPFAKNAKTYFYYGALNVIAGVALSVLSGYVPSPLTMGGQYIGLIIGGVTLGIMGITGGNYYRDAFKRFILKQNSDMNTLIALGTGSAWVYSMLICLMPTFFPVGALQYHFLATNMILGIVNFGKGVRQIAEEYAHKQVLTKEASYRKYQPLRALRQRWETDKFIYEDIPFEEIQMDDVLLLSQGQSAPVECTIISPATVTLLNEPVLGKDRQGAVKGESETIYTGSELSGITYLNASHNDTTNTNNIEGVLVKAQCNGIDNRLQQVLKRADTAADNLRPENATAKPRVSTRIDNIAKNFVPSIITIAGLSAFGWFMWGPIPQLPMMVMSAMSVLVCACPCAITLSRPIANMIGVYWLLDKNILMRNTLALEILNDVNTFVFDKTDTLTTSKKTAQVFLKEYSQPNQLQEILSCVASLERNFNDPRANALKNVSTNIKKCTQHELIEGRGVKGTVEGKAIYLGNQAMMENENIAIPDTLKQQAGRNDIAEKTIIYVARDRICVGFFVMEDELRSDARSAVQYLLSKNIDIHIYSGDTQSSANKVAKQLGIQGNQRCTIVGGLVPTDKQKRIQALGNESKRTIAFVGDGLNDLPAMNDSHVSIAIGTASVAATEADISIQNLNLEDLLTVSRETQNTINQNLIWALCYNILSIIVASGLLYPALGITLPPVVASFSMSLSSLFVVLNSSFLAFKIDEKLYEIEQTQRNGHPLSAFEKMKNRLTKMLSFMMPGAQPQESTTLEQAATQARAYSLSSMMTQAGTSSYGMISSIMPSALHFRRKNPQEERATKEEASKNKSKLRHNLNPNKGWGCEIS